MRRYATILVLLFCAITARAQEDFVVTIPTTLADTTETFWLQIPAGYVAERPCPLLIGWHQLGGNHLEMKNATQFDSVANARGWIAACHDGPSSTHWNNHATQSHVVDVIRWIEGRYAVDADRIYMVGASMGGAAGMVFSNNHLDPEGPRVAAAASLSGIQDCERRFHEQGWNNSMYGAFGGTPEEVPYEYHRNSAIGFADSTQSMHYNARHLPLFLTFGNGTSDAVWRSHAEDLYAVMHDWADTVVLHESALTGHGWGCAEEGLTCDFLGAFTLNRTPLALSVNADEEGHWYWTDLRMRDPDSSFARIEVVAEPASAGLRCVMVRNVASAILDLAAIDFPFLSDSLVCRWAVRDDSAAELGLRGLPVCPIRVERDGVPYDAWTYDPLEPLLTLTGEGDACYTIRFDAASATEAHGSRIEQPRIVWDPGPGELVCRQRPGETLHWAIYDAGGRRLCAGLRIAGGDGAIHLALPRAMPGGVYFAALSTSGATPGRARRRFVLLR